MIVNPVAGFGSRVEEITKAVKEVFSDEEGIFEVRATGKQGDGFRLSKEARELGYDTVFACGGDGTINEVASALVGSEVTLGIISAGSGNGLSRALGIPEDPVKALELVVKGKKNKIDVGTVLDKYFFSTAGIGFDAVLSKRYNSRAGGARRGLLPYVPMALYEFLRYRPTEVKIKWADGKFSSKSPFLLTVANTEEYGGGARIAPGAVADDGLLDFCIIEDVGFFSALMIVKKLLNGTIEKAKGFAQIKASSFKIKRDDCGLLHVDGEPVDGKTENGILEFKSLPKALKVWCCS